MRTRARNATARYLGTAPVGSYGDGVGRWGLLDMSGNVYEWTEDAEIMGGSALSSSEHELQSLAGDRVTPSTRRFDLGFRCAADPQPAEDKRRRRR